MGTLFLHDGGIRTHDSYSWNHSVEIMISMNCIIFLYFLLRIYFFMSVTYSLLFLCSSVQNPFSTTSLILHLALFHKRSNREKVRSK